MAPEAALYFRPDGYVAACCGTWHLLGRITGPERQSLREIWDGAESRQLRDALRAGDFGLGCWECGRAASNRQRSASLAATFDRYATVEPRRFPAVIDFALSNRCNLACVMCNGGLSSTIRAQREHRPPLPVVYDDRFFEELDEFLPHLVRAQFKGGEPFLIPEYRRIWGTMSRGTRPREVCVTTNGTIWDDHIEQVVHELAMEVIVSVDAVDPDLLRAIRVGADADRLWRNVGRFRDATHRAGSTLTLCLCLMSTNWWELAPFLIRADQLGVFASLIWVDGPARFNMLSMPRKDLIAARERLGAQSGSVAGLRSDLRRQWDDVLERIESVIRASGEAGSSSVGRGPSAARRMASVLDRCRAELRAGSCSDLLELEYEHDVIRKVTTPTWAAWLKPDTWVGTGLEQIMTMLAMSVGTTMRSEVRTMESGIHEALFTVGVDGLRIEARYVPAEPGDSLSHVLLALRDLPPDRVP